ncbi:MAG: DUF4290 domain-containing protein [Bacteroidetes bacterium]|nr:DUF4290 domain-containing protein [Bacteroidota bacterium]
MEYNSGRPHLVLPEYGRNIQKMVDFALTIEDRDKRTNVAKTIINIMAQINPQVKESTDYKQKLWDHLYIISDFKLDVETTYVMPSPEVLKAKPDRIPYTIRDFKYGHYGRNIQKIIEKVAEMEDSPEKEALVNTIANHLKKAFLTWNRDSVNDEVIYEHLAELSKGKLKLSEDTRLQHTNELLGRPPGMKKKKFFPRQKDNNLKGRKK